MGMRKLVNKLKIIYTIWLDQNDSKSKNDKWRNVWENLLNLKNLVLSAFKEWYGEILWV